MPKARLGVALLLPPPVASEVDGLRRALGDPSLGRIPPHLTLVPPVNVAGGRLGDALGVLRRAAAETAPFVVELGPPATFLPDNPVVYLDVGGDAGAVRALRDRVSQAPLERATSWPFVPHVTVADSARPDATEAALVALGDYRAEVRFERLHLLREGPGRVWEPIADAPFHAPAVVGRGGLALELSVARHLDPEAAALVREAEGGEPFAVTARRDQRVVGVAAGWVGGTSAHLERLVVDAALRRQGIGSHLLAAVESMAGEEGCHAVEAAGALGAGARAFLVSRGWTEGASPCLRRVLD